MIPRPAVRSGILRYCRAGRCERGGWELGIRMESIRRAFACGERQQGVG